MGDVASEQDRRWRRFFRGKVTPQTQHPESLLYSYLTVPRFTAPRWYLEGSAVFMETWMGGGLGRAQGGYDEMVFRAMVRDDARFYDPLGLESRGIARRLPGRRERLPLRHALLHLARLRAYAREGGRVAAARRGQRALLRRPVPAGVRHAARARPGRTGSPSSTSSSGATSPRCASSRSRRTATLARQRARLDLARLLRRGERHALRRLPLSGRRRARRRAQHARRAASGSSPTSSGAMLYRVTSFAYDPASGTALLHQRQPRAAAT